MLGQKHELNKLKRDEMKQLIYNKCKSMPLLLTKEEEQKPWVHVTVLVNEDVEKSENCNNNNSSFIYISLTLL